MSVTVRFTANVLQRDMGADPERVVIFHSLSKRPICPDCGPDLLPGAKTITQLKTMRAYSGAPLPLPLQRAAEAVWADEAHVIQNRSLRKNSIGRRYFGKYRWYETHRRRVFL